MTVATRPAPADAHQIARLLRAARALPVSRGRTRQVLLAGSRVCRLGVTRPATDGTAVHVDRLVDLPRPASRLAVDLLALPAVGAAGDGSADPDADPELLRAATARSGTPTSHRLAVRGGRP